MPLEPLADGLWTAGRKLRMPLGVMLPAQSAVVRLADGGVVVFSPIPRLLEVAPELRTLGPLRAIVAPNRLHHLGVAALHAEFPEAKLLARPSLQKKRADLPWSGTLGEAADPLWASELEQVVVGGIPVLDEVVFFHRPSRSLLLFDLCFHMRDLDGWSHFWLSLLQATDRFGPSRTIKFATRDRAALRASVDKILAWDVERIVPCHGRVIPTGGRAALEQAFKRLRG